MAPRKLNQLRAATSNYFGKENSTRLRAIWTPVADSNVRDTFTKMASIFPTENPESIKVVGAHTFRGQEYSTTDIPPEYQFPSKWLLVSVATRKEGDLSTVIGFHVNPMPDSLENLNKFSLLGKGVPVST